MNEERPSDQAERAYMRTEIVKVRGSATRAPGFSKSTYRWDTLQAQPLDAAEEMKSEGAVTGCVAGKASELDRNDTDGQPRRQCQSQAL